MPAETKDIKQKVTFSANPRQIYDLLVDPKQHAAFTESAATMDPKQGGKFSAYGGYIEGTNIELLPGKRIVQRWHAADWPDGHFSIATFELRPAKNGTELIFTQTGVPAEHAAAISKGWHEHYWDKMQAFLR